MEPAFEFPDGDGYEDAVAGLVETIRAGRAGEGPAESRPAGEALMGSPATDGGIPDDVLARITLAWLGCNPCPHVRQHAGQPHVAQLPIHRLACERCAKTVVKAPPENDDRCDFCRSHGHTHFWPVRMSYGPVLFMGDACDACHTKLKAGLPEDPAG
ncbi:MAG TPA: hypothetical protein VHL53_00545 [Acidimicrobiia bacterium]|nr:hypothetical protein [Acidimicrobiia bacterium]